MNLSCVITDLYFLRRFLDKKYIKNGIIYTGSSHMIDLIYLLTKYFNYELTHTYYISKPLKTRIQQIPVLQENDKSKISKYIKNNLNR